MIFRFVEDIETRNTVILIGALLAFVLTFIGLRIFEKKLPTDGGREFAVDGSKSIGKPRGAGIVFILVFTLISVFFGMITFEYLLYFLIIILCMLTGFLDDASSVPWSELKKGILDLAVSVMTAVVYIYHNGSDVHFALAGADVHFHPVVFGILAVALVWGSINVTNCCDGVDGLCGAVSIASVVSIYALALMLGKSIEMGANVLFMISVLLAYLWYNSTPSRMLMGDAGSRAIGAFLAIAVLLTGAPFMYLMLCLIILLDGGLGLFKVTVIRIFKFPFLKNLRTPLHDHFRKKGGWSNTQVVNRFLILQVLISLIALGMVK
ncbi:MAG: phospho-N-acetylmuramoyl-pentapeptide-transferase [Lachnospiraceae bacterium]|nr:phospho-N-acetylmuramoyl-pentapeptide-transferase [Lachnospiraceae bacterium]